MFVVAAVKESQANTNVVFELLGLANLPHIQVVIDLKAGMFITGTQAARAK